MTKEIFFLLLYDSQKFTRAQALQLCYSKNVIPLSGDMCTVQYFNPKNQIVQLREMNQWIWEGRLTNFSDFANWNGPEGRGCAPACIYEKNRLLMRYPTGKWEATTATTLLPYICASDCAVGYVWRRESRKCVKIVRPAAAKFTQAKVQCSADNGRLLHIATCHDFYALGRDLWFELQDISSSYWLGYYSTG
jgi:hypothetical protein